MIKDTTEKLVKMQQAAKKRYKPKQSMYPTIDLPSAIKKYNMDSQFDGDLSDLPWRSQVKKPITVGWMPPNKKVDPAVKKKVVEDKPKEPIKRPPTVYSNIPSHYGIYDELKDGQ